MRQEGIGSSTMLLLLCSEILDGQSTVLVSGSIGVNLSPAVGYLENKGKKSVMLDSLGSSAKR